MGFDLRRIITLPGEPKKAGHVVGDGIALCEGKDRWLRDYKTEHITFEQFLHDEACDARGNILDGTYIQRDAPPVRRG